MSLQAILDAVLAAGEGEVRQIEERAAIRAREIIANNMQAAEQAREDACSAASLPASRECAGLLHDARLKALQTIGAVRESLVDDAIEQIRQQLQNTRQYANYPTILRQLLQEALSELGEDQTVSHEKIQVEADPRDREAVESILAETGWKLTPLYQLDCWGGILARSADQRIVVINTLETRLEHAMPYLRRYLAAALEDEHAPTGKLACAAAKLPAQAAPSHH